MPLLAANSFRPTFEQMMPLIDRERAELRMSDDNAYSLPAQTTSAMDTWDPNCLLRMCLNMWDLYRDHINRTVYPADTVC